MELVSLLVALIGCAAAIIVIPEVRRWLKLTDRNSQLSSASSPPPIQRSLEEEAGLARREQQELLTAVNGLRDAVRALAEQPSRSVAERLHEDLSLALDQLRQPVQVLTEVLPQLLAEQKQLRADLYELRRSVAGPPPPVGGFAGTQARLLALTARRADLELQAQFVNEQRLRLGNGMSSLYDALSDGGPDADVVRERIQYVRAADKVLEMNLNRLNSQRDAIYKEIESVRRVIGRNIEVAFRMAPESEPSHKSDATEKDDGD
jgi:chromosome segregation ATPase